MTKRMTLLQKGYEADRRGEFHTWFANLTPSQKRAYSRQFHKAFMRGIAAIGTTFEQVAIAMREMARAWGSVKPPEFPRK